MTNLRFTAISIIVIAATVDAQGPSPLGSIPKAAIPDAKPVRSCESLATVALPNTKIETAIVDANNPAICRVTAVVTNPPANDKVTVWVGIPLSNWNGRFLGTGGGGYSGGSAAGVNQPLAIGYASGATDTGQVEEVAPSRRMPTDGSTGRRSATTRTSGFTK